MCRGSGRSPPAASRGPEALDEPTSRRQITPGPPPRLAATSVQRRRGGHAAFHRAGFPAVRVRSKEAPIKAKTAQPGMRRGTPKTANDPCRFKRGLAFDVRMKRARTKRREENAHASHTQRGLSGTFLGRILGVSAPLVGVQVKAAARALFAQNCEVSRTQPGRSCCGGGGCCGTRSESTFLRGNPDPFAPSTGAVHMHAAARAGVISATAAHAVCRVG